MMQLLILRRLAHDPQCVLTAVYGFALVGIKLRLNIRILELSITPFAHSEGWRGLFHDPQFALPHDCSLAHPAGGGVTPVEIKRHHYPRFPIPAVPSGLRKAGLPLTPSLNTGIAFARSDFSDIAPSFTSFGPIFLLLPLAVVGR